MPKASPKNKDQIMVSQQNSPSHKKSCQCERTHICDLPFLKISLFITSVFLSVCNLGFFQSNLPALPTPDSSAHGYRMDDPTRVAVYPFADKSQFSPLHVVSRSWNGSLNMTSVLVSLTANIDYSPLKSYSRIFRLVDEVYQPKHSKKKSQNVLRLSEELFFPNWNQVGILSSEAYNNKVPSVTIKYPLNSSVTTLDEMEYKTKNFRAPQDGYILLEIENDLGKVQWQLNASTGFFRLRGFPTGQYRATLSIHRHSGQEIGSRCTIMWTYVNQRLSKTHLNSSLTRPTQGLELVSPLPNTRTSSTLMQISVPPFFAHLLPIEMVIQVNKRRKFTLLNSTGFYLHHMTSLNNGKNKLKVTLRNSDSKKILDETKYILFEFRNFTMKPPTVSLSVPKPEIQEMLEQQSPLHEAIFSVSYVIKNFNFKRDGMAVLKVGSSDPYDQPVLTHVEASKGNIKLKGLLSPGYEANLSLVSYAGVQLGFSQTIRWKFSNHSLVTWQDTEVTTFMYNLIAKGDARALMIVMKESPEMVWCRSGDGRGPLFWAYEFRQMEMVELLLQAGLREDDQDAEGLTPSMMSDQIALAGRSG